MQMLICTIIHTYEYISWLYACTDDIEEAPYNVIEIIKFLAKKETIEVPHTTRSFLQRARKVNMHTTIYGIIQVLWPGRPDNEATWVLASSLPSSVIKEFEECIRTTGIEMATMARKHLPLVLQNSLSMIQNEYVGHNQLLKKPQGKPLIIIILLYQPVQIDVIGIDIVSY